MNPIPVPPPTSDAQDPARVPRGHAPTTRWHWLKEPLLHFAVVGFTLFAVDAWVVSGQANPNAIVLTAATDAELTKVFVESRGRPPNEAERAALRQRWFDNEVLYREGLALGLDRGDIGIRERVIFKSLSVVEAGLQRPVPDDATVKAWFEQQRSRYDKPQRVDLFEAVMPGKPSLAEVQAFAKALNDGRADTAEAGLRIFRARPMGNIQESFGAEFATVLADLPLKVWHALETPTGPRAMMVELRTPGQAVSFGDVRDEVLADWLDQRMAELRTAGVRTVAAKYTLRVAGEPQP